MQLSPEFRQSR